jgi:hypothetical protein
MLRALSWGVTHSVEASDDHGNTLGPRPSIIHSLPTAMPCPGQCPSSAHRPLSNASDPTNRARQRGAADTRCLSRRAISRPRAGRDATAPRGPSRRADQAAQARHAAADHSGQRPDPRLEVDPRRR